MTFALLILCGLSGSPCQAMTYNEAPYADVEACKAAHARRRPVIMLALGEPTRVREICGDLKRIRSMSPNAYPDHAIDEAV